MLPTFLGVAALCNAQGNQSGSRAEQLLRTLLDQQQRPFSAVGHCYHFFEDETGEPLNGDVAYNDFQVIRAGQMARYTGKTGGWAGGKPQVFDRGWDGAEYRTYDRKVQSEYKVLSDYEDVVVEIVAGGRGAKGTTLGFRYTVGMPQYGGWLHGHSSATDRGLVAGLLAEDPTRLVLTEHEGVTTVSAHTDEGEYYFDFGKSGDADILVGMRARIDADEHAQAELPEGLSESSVEVTDIEYSDVDGVLFPVHGHLRSVEHFANNTTYRVSFDFLYSDVKFSTGFEKEDFVVAFPPGTEVWDRDAGIMLLATEGGFTPAIDKELFLGDLESTTERMASVLEEIKADTTTAPAVSNPIDTTVSDGKAASERGSSRVLGEYRWVVFALSFLLLSALAVGLWISRKSSHNKPNS